METKFLSDGRKVAVVGSLNSVEFIVQEIFVTKEGDEIPSGERFTTKSLHDAPVESYASREKKRIEADLNKLKNEEEAIKASIRKLKEDRNLNQQMVGEIKRITSGLQNVDAQYIADVLSGNVKYAVRASFYSTYEPENLDSLIKSKESSNFEQIKLMSVWGRSNGDLTYRISQYSDGSGGSEEYYFARNESELKQVYQKKYQKLVEWCIENDRKLAAQCSIQSLDIFLKYGVKIPKDIQTAIVKESIADLEGTHSRNSKTYDEQSASINEKVAVLKARLSNKK